MDCFKTYERVSTPKGDLFREVGEDSTPSGIYVLDTETTGLEGAPKDLVVDVGICKVDLIEGTVEDVYSSVLGYETEDWDDYLRNAWIFQNTDMTLEMVEEAPRALTIIDDVRRILRKQAVTTFNTGYDLDKFLYKEPCSMRGWFIECKDIMKAATEVCKLPSPYFGGSYKYPKLDYAYAQIVDGDPAEIHGKQDHRALSDARMASHLMIAMYRNGQYRP